MVTQNDIARRLQISQALVSKVLNDKVAPGTARPDLVKTIRQTAKQMGYVKNRSSIELLSGRHHVIGVFHRRLGGSGLFEPLVTGIAEEADRQHQKLWLQVYDERTDLTELLSRTNRGTIDGLIFGSWFHKQLIKPLIDLQKNGLRIIHPTDDAVYPRLSSVPRPRVTASHLATTHLLEQGCRKIAYVGLFFWRLQGYKNALKEHGLRPNPKLQIEVGDFTNRDSKLGAEKLLNCGSSFDGVVFESDQFAFGAIEVLLAHGLKIPQEVKLVGIDNLPFCEHTPVPLTSVCKQEHQRGIVAVKMLIDLIHDQKPKPVRMTPQLHIRQSSRRLTLARPNQRLYRLLY